MQLKEALGTELDMIELRRPRLEAVVKRGRQVRRRRRGTVGVLVAAVVATGSATYLGADAWVGDRGTYTVSAAVRPPGAPADLVGEGTIDGHTWAVRITQPSIDQHCAEGTMDNQPLPPSCSTPPQLLVGDRTEGIGHLNFSSGPIDAPYGSVIGVASDEVALVVLRIGNAKAEAVPVDVGTPHHYFAFVFKFEDQTKYTLTAYDAAGKELSHSAAK